MFILENERKLGSRNNKNNMHESNFIPSTLEDTYVPYTQLQNKIKNIETSFEWKIYHLATQYKVIV